MGSALNLGDELLFGKSAHVHVQPSLLTSCRLVFPPPAIISYMSVTHSTVQGTFVPHLRRMVSLHLFFSLKEEMALRFLNKEEVLVLGSRVKKHEWTWDMVWPVYIFLRSLNLRGLWWTRRSQMLKVEHNRSQQHSGIVTWPLSA